MTAIALDTAIHAIAFNPPDAPFPFPTLPSTY
jgi:hypothetical protein